MADLSPVQVRNRSRVESVIGLAAPFLDLILGVGDRVSRIVEPEDQTSYAVRTGSGERGSSIGEYTPPGGGSR